MNQRMPKQLPTFKGYTVDFRLREFRRVDSRLPSIGFIPFDSAEGQKLLEEMPASEGATHQRTRIQRNPADICSWLCLCGNSPTAEGFYPCDSEGEQVEPTPEYWTTNWYVCDRCGRIIDQDTLAVVGVRFHNALTFGELQEIYECRPFPTDTVDEITRAAKMLSRTLQELKAHR
jgi:hypothetical protein